MKSVVEQNKPDILVSSVRPIGAGGYPKLSLTPTKFTASMWTPDETQEIIAIAKEIVPYLKTFSLPQGLQVQKGPDAVVEYIKEHLSELL